MFSFYRLYLVLELSYNVLPPVRFALILPADLPYSGVLPA